MKCPVCDREVVGKSCSYCGTVIEPDMNQEEFKKNAEKIKQMEKRLRLLNLLIFFSVIFIIIPIFIPGFTIISIILMVCNVYYLFSKLKHFTCFSKMKFYLYLGTIVSCGLLSIVSTVKVVSEWYKGVNAYKEYSELVNIDLPKKTMKYEYISDKNKGYKIERFNFTLSDDEIEILLSSNEHFETINEQDNKEIFNIWYNNIKEGKYLVYDIINENYEDVKDKKLYHYVIVLIKDNNTVVIDEITQTPTEYPTTS